MEMAYCNASWLHYWNEMLTLWPADKVLDALDGEQELSSQAIEVAQEQIKDL